MCLHHRPNGDTVCNQLVHCSPTNEDLFSLLSEEIIGEIFLKIPIRSIYQLKCVCKSWKTLISYPQFAKIHLRVSTAEPSLTHKQLVFSVKSKPYQIVSYPLKPLFHEPSNPNKIPIKPNCFNTMKKHEFCIIGSCNGLLCLFDISQGCARLCNPSIRLKSKKSPKAVSLDWEVQYYGFGYDQVNDKYKVVIVLQNKNVSSEKLTKIYTFGEDSWKTIQNFSCTPTRKLGKFVSGTLNWVSHKSDVSSTNQMMILSFNIEKETFGELSLPQFHGQYGSNVLYVFNNCLCVSQCYDTLSSWSVWMMKEYGVVESWTKLRLVHSDYVSQPPTIVDPMLISDYGTALLVAANSSHFTPHVVYNLLDDCGLDCLFIRGLGLDLHIYHESMISPRR